jgi:hypothetical protein
MHSSSAKFKIMRCLEQCTRAFFSFVFSLFSIVISVDSAMFQLDNPTEQTRLLSRPVFCGW